MIGVPPLISDVSRPWWDALAREEISVQQCDRCSNWVFYPRAFCPACGNRSLTWTSVGGSATLYTWSIANVPVSPLFAHLDKPILGIAELATGLRIPTTIVDADHGAVRIGMPWLPVFDYDTYPDCTLLRFRPA